MRRSLGAAGRRLPRLARRSCSAPRSAAACRRHQALPRNLTDRQTIVIAGGGGPIVSPCLKLSSSPPAAPPSDGPSRARSRTAVPTTSPPSPSRRSWPRSRRSTRRSSRTSSSAAVSPPARPGSTSPRVAALLAGIDVPGITVNRYCSSSLNRHPHRRPRHQGRRGRRVRGRRRRDLEPLPVRHGRQRLAQHPLRRRPGPHRRPQHRRGRRLDPARRAARHLHRDGPDGRERRRARGRLPRGDGRVRRPLPAARGRLPGARLLRPRDHPRHHPRRHRGDASTTAPAPAPPSRSCATLQPAFKPNGKVTAGNACPLNDGAAAVVVMSDTKANELGLTPLARIVSSGVSALSPEIMGLGPIEAVAQALDPRRPDHRPHRPGRDQRGVRRPGRAVGQRARHRPRRRSSTRTAAPSPSATRSA